MLQGNVWDYFIVFGSGVAVSFTPCIYPVLPVIASLIAGFNTDGKFGRGFILSFVYVLGMAVVYCGLAVFAALTGRLFGEIQTNPWMFIAVVGVLVVFALALFDVISLPSLGITLQHRQSKHCLWNIFLAGMASGFMAGPCTAPILGTLLLYVASRQNVLHGISLTLVFSLGVGFSVMLVGTFSGLLGKLPKSGMWLVWVKKLCGAILLVTAGYVLIKAWTLFGYSAA